jgi:hypothetical protein
VLGHPLDVNAFAGLRHGHLPPFEGHTPPGLGAAKAERRRSRDGPETGLKRPRARFPGSPRRAVIRQRGESWRRPKRERKWNRYTDRAPSYARRRQASFSVVGDLVENLMGIPGAVAVTRAEPSMEPRRRTGGEPAYVVYYRGRWTPASFASSRSKARMRRPASGAAQSTAAPRSRSRVRGWTSSFRDLDG